MSEKLLVISEVAKCNILKPQSNTLATTEQANS